MWNLDPMEYIVEDKLAQKKFQFDLKKSISCARTMPLYTGRYFHVTKHVKPGPEDMQAMIEAAGEKKNLPPELSYQQLLHLFFFLFNTIHMIQ